MGMEETGRHVRQVLEGHVDLARILNVRIEIVTSEVILLEARLRSGRNIVPS